MPAEPSGSTQPSAVFSTESIWIGLFEAFGILELREAFDVAFWISFTMHAAVAELYLRWRPSASGRPRRVTV